MLRIEEGLKGTMEKVVEDQDLASFKGNIGADVLSTHCIVLLMEQAARKAIEGRLTPDKITVGTMINLRHFAATPLGAKVRAEALLREVEGRKLVFEVVVYDDVEKVAEGVNERYIVSIDKFLEKVRKKRDNEQ
jgi:predicted thioesterase